MKLSRRDIVKLGVATGASTLLPDFLSAVDAETQYRVEGQSMVTRNVIQRVFKIRRGESQGTAFTIDRAGRQYFVTARHVIESGMCPESCRKASWRKAPADWLTTLPRYAA